MSTPPTSTPGPASKAATKAWPLYLTVFLIATAGLVYELVAGAVASYLLGDSVTQFSLVIGLYLSALGVGAYASKFLENDLGERFVEVELATALVGGTSAPLLLFAFGHGVSFQLILYGVVALTGVLVGLELPLLMRLLGDKVALKDLVAKALLFDYLGALAASVLFALILVPRLGLVRTSLLFGLLNALVGLASTWLIPDQKPTQMRKARVRALVVCAILLGLFSQAKRLVKASEVALYGKPLLYADQSPYQRIIITKGKTSFALFLNNNLQFSSVDEVRYHEALIHPVLATHPNPANVKQVLIAGGGDGLAARELLKYPQIRQITLVDLDPAMTKMARGFSPLYKLNGGALDNPRLKLINGDAMHYLSKGKQHYDLIVVDFPDPNHLALGKLYTPAFFRSARRHLRKGGRIGVQATSPLFSRKSYWCIAHTMAASGLHILPYHGYVPSFGEWGFVAAAAEPLSIPSHLPAVPMAYLRAPRLAAMFNFPPDMGELPTGVNRLDTQELVLTYAKEIGRYARLEGVGRKKHDAPKKFLTKSRLTTKDSAPSAG